MTTVADVVDRLAERTSPEQAAYWDPVGLQLGDATAPVNSIGVCHEVTEKVVARIEASAVDLLITYHPLLFEPVNRVVAGRSAPGRAFRLIRAGVNLLVTHTDFDAAPGGAAEALASAFGFHSSEPFGEDSDEGIPAIGRLSAFDGTLAMLDARASDRFGPSGLRIHGDRAAHISNVVVIPGSGSEFIPRVAEVADALVTGDVSHHRAVAAIDLGLSIVDPGHVATERPGMKALVGMVESVSGEAKVVDLTGISPTTWS